MKLNFLKKISQIFKLSVLIIAVFAFARLVAAESMEPLDIGFFQCSRHGDSENCFSEWWIFPRSDYVHAEIEAKFERHRHGGRSKVNSTACLFSTNGVYGNCVTYQCTSGNCGPEQGNNHPWFFAGSMSIGIDPQSPSGAYTYVTSFVNDAEVRTRRMVSGNWLSEPPPSPKIYTVACVTKNSETEQPIEGAVCNIDGQTGITNQDGYRSFDSVREGEQLLFVGKDGYRDYYDTRNITGNTDWQVSLSPTISPTPTPTSTISPSPTISPATSPSPTTSPTLTPTPTMSPLPATNPETDRPPVGYLDAVGCGTISGWAFDPDVRSSSINIDVYINGPASQGIKIGRFPTDVLREDVNNAFSIAGNHGFSVATPSAVKDGKAYSVYVYGINNNQSGRNLLISKSPTTIQCGSGRVIIVNAPILVTPLGYTPERYEYYQLELDLNLFPMFQGMRPDLIPIALKKAGVLLYLSQ